MSPARPGVHPALCGAAGSRDHEPVTGSWAAVVLAGGRARRFGGVDKVGLLVRGRTLLDGVLAACAGASELIVVGPRRATEHPVRWAREEPPYAGPVAALAAGVGMVPQGIEELAVLAADLSGLTGGTLDRLRTALGAEPGAAGAVLVDGEGQAQWLCGVWRLAAVRKALAEVGEPAGLAVHAVLGPLRPIQVPALSDEAHDVDRPGDL
jgi:molybdopterin-guanine dinucleotide biosynthesis protein A